MNEAQQLMFDRVAKVIEQKREQRKHPEHCLMIGDLSPTKAEIEILRQLVRLRKLNYGDTIRDYFFTINQTT